jgi:hypothetical protein
MNKSQSDESSITNLTNIRRQIDEDIKDLNEETKKIKDTIHNYNARMEKIYSDTVKAVAKRIVKSIDEDNNK